MKFRYLLLLLITLPLFSGCNQEDDVLDIFTGKTWKLTGIFHDKGSNPSLCTDYWNSDAEKEASDELFKEKDNFTITFIGAEIDGKVVGTYGGRASRNSISGDWSANGDNNSFGVSKQDSPKSNEDILGKAFVNGLINAYKYDGDTNGNLRIYFEDTERNDKRFLLFGLAR